MSTSYYPLKDPITSLSIANDVHSKITFWIRHKNSGTLTVDRNDTASIVLMLIDDTNAPAMTSYYGGDKIGTIVVENKPNLLAEQILVSEYGKVLNISQIREKRVRITKKEE